VPEGPDFAIGLAGPVDGQGRLTHGRVVAGVPFTMRLELRSRGVTGTASVVYELELPTGVHVAEAGRSRASPPESVRLRMSTCLHACTIGWDTSRRRRTFVYYAFVVPVAADAMISAHITGTNHPDRIAADDRVSTSVTAVPQRLALGAPQLVTGPPRAARAFAIAVPVRVYGEAVSPDAVRCVAEAGKATLRGAAVRRHGIAECGWTLPPGIGATTLRVRVTVAARSLRVSGSWLFSVGR
jgi:(2Fe-2S) ferredoxin